MTAFIVMKFYFMPITDKTSLVHQRAHLPNKSRKTINLDKGISPSLEELDQY